MKLITSGFFVPSIFDEMSGDTTPGGLTDVWEWEAGIGMQWETGIFIQIN